jgi:hypothetical protein
VPPVCWARALSLSYSFVCLSVVLGINVVHL